MVPLLLIGAGGHTKSCIDVIEKEGKFQIAGLIGQNNEVNKSILGYKIIGSDLDLPNLRKKYEFAFITIGQIKTPSIRIKMFQILKQLNFQIPVIQSPFAIISKNSEIGEGTIIHHNTVIYSKTKIGRQCVINTNVSIGTEGLGLEFDKSKNCYVKIPQIGSVNIGDQVEIGPNSTIRRSAIGETKIGNGTKIGSMCNIGHNCVLGQNNLLTSNVILGGSSKVGNDVYFGISSTIRNRVKIGDSVVIGQGAVVVKDIPDGETWVDNPAKKINK